MVEASWQPDPDDGARLRWWDGTRWTEHVAPGPEGQEVGAAPMRTTAGPPVSPGLAPATDHEASSARGDDEGWDRYDTPGTDATDRAADHDTTEIARAAGTADEPEDAPAGAGEQGAPTSGDAPAYVADRDTEPPVWTASEPRSALPTEEPSASAGDHQPGRDATPRSDADGADPVVRRTATPSTGAGPTWSVGPATGADDRSEPPRTTARTVHRIIAAVGVLLLVFAAIQMIALTDDAFSRAVGWGLLGATLWGACLHSMREIEAERSAGRDRARDEDPRQGPSA